MVMTEKELVKQAAEADLLTFIRLVAPHRMLGSVHEDLCSWWCRDDALDNQLVLLPRDHQKSAMIAYRVAWWITKHPETTVLYVSATANVTGLHCNVAVLDDVVVPDNAYTQIGRDAVRAFYSQLSSIESTGAKEWAVGTRYHPGDLYKDMMEMSESSYDEEADVDVE